MTICVSRPQADSFTGHAKNVTFLQLTDLITDVYPDLITDVLINTESDAAVYYFAKLLCMSKKQSN